MWWAVGLISDVANDPFLGEGGEFHVPRHALIVEDSELISELQAQYISDLERLMRGKKYFAVLYLFGGNKKTVQFFWGQEKIF